MAQAESDTSRWWEFYAVRYGMGAVVGALILFLLVREDARLQHVFFVKLDERLDIVQVTMLLGLGLVYCYVASAPFLVLHMGRYMMPRRPERKFSWPSKSMLQYLFSTLLVVVAFYWFVDVPTQMRMWFTLVFTCFSAAFLGQMFIVMKAYYGGGEMYSFYLRLANKRDKSKGGIVDSYRHLREHGNSFGIVFMEVMLAVVLFAVTALQEALGVEGRTSSFSVACTFTAVLLVWMFPAVLVWVVGHIFEREFVES